MRKSLGVLAFLFMVLIAVFVPRARADGVYFTMTPLYTSSGWHYGDKIFVHNPFSDDVDVHPYMSSATNVTWQLVDVTVEAGGSIYCGWVANQANTDAWNYNLAMKVATSKDDDEEETPTSSTPTPHPPAVPSPTSNPGK